METITEILQDGCDALTRGGGRPNKQDIAIGLRCIQIAMARMKHSPVNRASRLLYQEMDKWATFEKGTVKPEVIVELLSQEALLRDE